MIFVQELFSFSLLHKKGFNKLTAPEYVAAFMGLPNPSSLKDIIMYMEWRMYTVQLHLGDHLASPCP